MLFKKLTFKSIICESKADKYSPMNLQAVQEFAIIYELFTGN